MAKSRFRIACTLSLVVAGCGSSGGDGPATSGGAGPGPSAGAPSAGTTAAGTASATAGVAGQVAAQGGATGGVAGGTLSSGGTAGGPATGGSSGNLPSGGTGGAMGGGGTGLGGSAGAAGAAMGGAFGGGGGMAMGGSGGSGGAGGSGSKCGPVTAVPDAVRMRLGLDPFYEKYVDANGVPVLASSAPADEALIAACELLNNMLSKRDDVRQELIRRRARFAIIGKSEGTADIPEYGYREKSQSDIDYINERARGLGGIVASCGEENILCLSGDRYRRESICVHEFAHTISMYGAYSADDEFQDKLEEAYESARASGILQNTYRSENIQEYWAEGVQDWYDTNDWASPPNGIHNEVNTRAELADYDPKLYALVAELFPEETRWGDCHVDD